MHWRPRGGAAASVPAQPAYRVWKYAGYLGVWHVNDSVQGPDAKQLGDSSGCGMITTNYNNGRKAPFIVTNAVESANGSAWFRQRNDYWGDATTDWTKFGVTPERIVDFLSLVGDSSDNIPGVPGVGPKTAAALIQEAGSIMEMLREPERIGKLSLREKVVSHRETLERNLRLVTLFTDLPPEAAIGNDSVKKAAPDKEAVSGLVREFELKSLAKDVEKLSSAPVTPSAPDLFSSSPLPEEERKENKGQEQLFFDF